jgi:hypothetical protein
VGLALAGLGGPLWPVVVAALYAAGALAAPSDPAPAIGRKPGEELLHQLDLLDDYVTVTSQRVFSSHTQEIVDFSAYLESGNEIEDLGL